MSVTPVVLSWSTGKDSAFSLLTLQRDPTVQVVGLLASVTETHDRVAMHGTRRSLLRAQAEAAGLPLYEAVLPWPCTNEDYERIMGAMWQRLVADGVQAVAFGDLYLEDIRAYRVKQLQGTGLQPLFPIWCGPEATPELAQQMVHAGIEATIVCVDPKQAPRSLAGRRWDVLVRTGELPVGVDPCGERGEFHTFVHGGPMFTRDIPVTTGEVVQRGDFVYADVLPA